MHHPKLDFQWFPLHFPSYFLYMGTVGANMSDRGTFSGDSAVDAKTKKEHKVPLLKLFSFADFYDCVLMALGSVGACIHGASVPVFFIFFGKLINVIGLAYLFPKEASHKVAKYSLDFVYLSIAILFSSWTEVACWMHTGERQAAKMRMAYLKSMLNQDIGLFDTEASTGEVISAITSDIIIVQDALSEKCLPHVLRLLRSRKK
ncbi:ABC transporter B family member 2, partial [Mucuna pruriens]